MSTIVYLYKYNDIYIRDGTILERFLVTKLKIWYFTQMLFYILLTKANSSFLWFIMNDSLLTPKLKLFFDNSLWNRKKLELLQYQRTTGELDCELLRTNIFVLSFAYRNVHFIMLYKRNRNTLYKCWETYFRCSFF